MFCFHWSAYVVSTVLKCSVKLSFVLPAILIGLGTSKNPYLSFLDLFKLEENIHTFLNGN